MNEREARAWWEAEQRRAVFRLRHPIRSFLYDMAVLVAPLLFLCVIAVLWLMTA